MGKLEIEALQSLVHQLSSPLATIAIETQVLREAPSAASLDRLERASADGRQLPDELRREAGPHPLARRHGLSSVQDLAASSLADGRHTIVPGPSRSPAGTEVSGPVCS